MKVVVPWCQEFDLDTSVEGSFVECTGTPDEPARVAADGIAELELQCVEQERLAAEATQREATVMASSSAAAHRLTAVQERLSGHEQGGNLEGAGSSSHQLAVLEEAVEDETNVQHVAKLVEKEEGQASGQYQSEWLLAGGDEAGC